MVTCRCDVINQMTGDAAVDYARRHLDVVRASEGGWATYRCPDTGITWQQERRVSPYGEDSARLRRLDRG